MIYAIKSIIYITYYFSLFLAPNKVTKSVSQNAPPLFYALRPFLFSPCCNQILFFSFFIKDSFSLPLILSNYFLLLRQVFFIFALAVRWKAVVVLPINPFFVSFAHGFYFWKKEKSVSILLNFIGILYYGWNNPLPLIETVLSMSS